jgi:ankyrin repeat protein
MKVIELLNDYQKLPEYSEVELEDVNQVSLFGDRPINIAATRGAIDEMATLIANGAHINNSGEHGYTPLHNAVEQGHVLAVEWLLKHGADSSLQNANGLNPLDLAKALDENDIITLISSRI